MSLTLLTIGTGAMLLATVALGIRRPLGPLSPFLIFGLGYTLVFGLFPICVLLSGESRWGYLVAHQHEYLRIETLGLVMLGYACALISYLATRAPRIQRGPPLSTLSSTRRDRVVFWVLLVVFLFAAALTYLLLVRTHLDAFGQFMTDRIFEMKGLAIIYKPLLLVFPLGFFLLLRMRESKGKSSVRWFILLISLCLINGSLAVLSGSRFGALMPLLYFGILAILISRGSGLTRGLLIKSGAVVLCVLLAVSIVGQMRKSVLGTDVAIDELGEVRWDEASLLLSEIRTSFPHFEILMIMLDRKMQWEYGLGGETLAGVLSVVPRKLWEGKPVGAGPKVANIIQPGSYNIHRLSGSSVTTGFLVEGLLAGGIGGVIIFMSVFGVVLSVLERKLASLGRDTWQVVGWVLFVIMVCEGLIYSEVYGWVGRVVVILAPVMLLNAVFKLRTGGVRRVAC